MRIGIGIGNVTPGCMEMEEISRTPASSFLMKIFQLMGFRSNGDTIIANMLLILKLEGACGSCPSFVTTMKLGIECRLIEKIPEIVTVEPILDEETGLELKEEKIEKVLEEISPYFVGAAGGKVGNWCR
ncbi:hypothetical protein LXL04_038767 [Taraxacum kok-saghyz]